MFLRRGLGFLELGGRESVRVADFDSLNRAEKVRLDPIPMDPGFPRLSTDGRPCQNVRTPRYT